MNQSLHLLTIADLDLETIAGLCVDAERLDQDRSGEAADVDLAHRTVALVFERPSTRTRLGFESGMAYLGGHAVALSGDAMQFGLGTEAESDRVLINRETGRLSIDRGVHFGVLRNADAPVSTLRRRFNGYDVKRLSSMEATLRASLLCSNRNVRGNESHPGSNERSHTV